jgi:transposase
LSVDDFAFRRGCRWGTVLVDLERHTLVDILPDRSADAFANWLSENLDVEVVSRDRGGEYGEYDEAARRVAPDAVRVADRFHLLKNLRDVILRVFKQHSGALDLVPTPDHYRQKLTNLRLDRQASKTRMDKHTNEVIRRPIKPSRRLSKKALHEGVEDQRELPNGEGGAVV